MNSGGIKNKGARSENYPSFFQAGVEYKIMRYYKTNAEKKRMVRNDRDEGNIISFPPCSDNHEQPR